MNQGTNWTDIINYFNSKKGRSVSIVDMECDLNHINRRLLTRYRSLLKRAGYLEIVRKGRYRVKRIPETLDLRKIYYPYYYKKENADAD